MKTLQLLHSSSHLRDACTTLQQPALNMVPNPVNKLVQTGRKGLQLLQGGHCISKGCHVERLQDGQEQRVRNAVWCNCQR